MFFFIFYYKAILIRSFLIHIIFIFYLKATLPTCLISDLILCLNSVYKWESILEIYNDATTFGLKSADSRAVNNSSMAISWLEATFPELCAQGGDGKKLYGVAKAQASILFDASVVLQVLQNLVHCSICRLASLHR